MEDTRMRLLQNMPVFGGLLEPTLEFLVERVQELAVASEDYFFHQDDRGSAAYVLERGTVSVVKSYKGREYLLRELGEGDCFGEMALIDFCPRSASVRANEPCIALCITGADLRAVREFEAEQFTLIYMNMAREVSRRLRDADLRLFEARAEAGQLADGYEVEGF